MVTAIVRAALAQHSGGWILDGYPRSLEQAESLSSGVEVDRVVAIEMRRDLLVRKVAGRRLCPDCGISWNVEGIDEDNIVMPPMLPSGEHNGTPCGERCIPKLTRRSDDQPEASRAACFHCRGSPCARAYHGQPPFARALPRACFSDSC